MTSLDNNRDLYQAITRVIKTYSNSDRSLEAYLIALRQKGIDCSGHEFLSLEKFISIIDDSFVANVQEYDRDWENDYEVEVPEGNFDSWLHTITRQIVDLHEMQSRGDLKNKLRFFGIKSPRNAHWVNFIPFGYLECGAVGSFGGWTPNDDTDRDFKIDNDSGDEKEPGQDKGLIQHMPYLDWGTFQEFLLAGQMYE